MNELYHIELFEDATDDELQWITAHSREVALPQGEAFFIEGERRDEFYVVLAGELQVSRTIGGVATVVGTTPRGIIGGEQHLLYGGASLITSRAIMDSRLLVLDLPAFRAMFGTCPTVGAKVLRIAAERTQGLTTLVKQQEKMAALGKLSAGLAHELNNPSAAAQSATKALYNALPDVIERTIALCGLGLQGEQFAALQALAARAATAHQQHLAPLERSDREDALALALEARGVADAWELAPSFVDVGLADDDLAALAEQLPSQALSGGLAWLDALIKVNGLLSEITNSTERISTLVGSVKSYTFMDQAPVQEVDIHNGLEGTLTMLGHKLRQGKIKVERAFDPDLPRITGRGGELNQVWTNLLDNAIDALATNGGTIYVITRCENNWVMVEIADNGPGIPREVLPRIFEPFFTTKGVGQGSGMGLDITYRIVKQHKGTIEVQSQPGNTRFIVRLPV